VTASLGFKSEPEFNERLFLPELAGGALFDVGIYPAMWISMVLGTPQKVTAQAVMTASGVDSQTFATFEYDNGAMAHMQCSFNGCLQNEIVIVGETGFIKVSAPTQAPDTYSITTRQDEKFDPLLQRGKTVTVTTPLDPPHYGEAPGYNFVGSQGFVYEAMAVHEALKNKWIEHPEMPLAETLAMAKIFDQVLTECCRVAFRSVVAAGVPHRCLLCHRFARK